MGKPRFELEFDAPKAPVLTATLHPQTGLKGFEPFISESEAPRHSKLDHRPKNKTIETI